MQLSELIKNKKYYYPSEKKPLYYEGKMFKGKYEFSDILGDPYLLTKEEVESLEKDS